MAWGVNITDQMLDYGAVVLKTIGVVSTVYGITVFMKNYFLKLALIFQLLLISVTLGISLVLFYNYFSKIQLYADFMDKAITTKLMTNDQPYKTIEAYALSGIVHKSTGNTDSDKQIKSEIDKFQKKLNELSEIADYNIKKRRESLDIKWKDSGTDKTQLIWIGKSDYGFLTGADSIYFLFQPGFTFQGFSFVKPAYRRFKDNIDIEFQVLSAYNAKQLLDYILSRSKIDELRIAQCYFMSDLGTLLIRGKNSSDANISYSPKLFEARKYFADRPYFWETHELKKSVGVYDYVSPPYIDYGNNGIVKTYCFKIDLPCNRRGIIAIDCAINNENQNITKKFKKVSESYITISLDKDGRLNLVNDDGFKNKDQFNSVIDAIEKSEKLKFDITRQIYIHDIEDTTKLICSIPISWGDNKSDVILFRISKNFVNNHLWMFVAAFSLFTLSISGIILLIYSYHISRNEQSEILNRLSLVMEDSKIQFAMFNEKGEFDAANKAWCIMLGYDSEDDMMFKNKSRGTRRNFIDLLYLQDDINRYKMVINKSKKGENTEAEIWHMVTKDDKHIRVKTHAEGVVIRRLFAKDQLKRFGIVIDFKSLPTPTLTQAS